MKKTNYESPQIEIIAIEVEDAILSASIKTTTLSSAKSGGAAF